MTCTTFRWTALLAAAALIAVGCGDSATSSSPTTHAPATSTVSTTATTTVSPTTTAPPTTAAPATTTPVERVVVATYFSRDGVLVAGSRAVATTDAARAAVAAVIDGPNADERAAAFTTAIPTGTTLRSVTIDQRKATVDVSNTFTAGGGSLSMRLRVAQIVYTLARLGSVDSVRFLIDGQAVEAIGGEGLIVTNVKPTEFDDLLPPVIVEFPTPGVTVAPGFTFKGLANVFEGTVNYQLLDANGALITEGFATGAMGMWSPFDAKVTFAARPAGLLTFLVFTVSPEDGTRQDQSSTAVRVG
jgi:spore germination protein GerM